MREWDYKLGRIKKVLDGFDVLEVTESRWRFWVQTGS